MPEPSSPPSPVDAMPGTQLEAHVVRPGPRPLLHGYDVHDDLARRYSFAEIVLTALTGETPTEEAGRAMTIALAFAAPITIAEAPSHVATLARRCGADHASVFAVAAIALAEQGRHRLEGHAHDLDDEGEREGVERLRAALAERSLNIPELADAPSLWDAILTVLRFCGLIDDWQLESAIAIARLPVAVAEAMSVARGDLRSYPMRVPPFAHEAPTAGTGR